MIKLNEVRQEVLTVFRDVHAANFPKTLVNYPQRPVVDIERQVDPFVSVMLDFTRVERSAIGERDLLVPGLLYVYYYYREGTGTSSSLIYYDEMNAVMGGLQEGSIKFDFAVPTVVKTFPGWEGLMMSFRFDVVSPMSC